MPLRPASSSNAKNGKPCQVSTRIAAGRAQAGSANQALKLSSTPTPTSAALMMPSLESSINAQILPATTIGRNHGSSTMTVNARKPGRSMSSTSAASMPSANSSTTVATTQTNVLRTDTQNTGSSNSAR